MRRFVASVVALVNKLSDNGHYDVCLKYVIDSALLQP